MAKEIHLSLNDLLLLKDKMKESAQLLNELCIETNEKIVNIIGSEWDDAQACNFQMHWEQEGKRELLKLSRTIWDFSEYVNKKANDAQRYLSKSINQ